MPFNALDDPLVPPRLIPFDEFASNSKIFLVTTKTGGHAIGHLRLRQPGRVRQAGQRQDSPARERKPERVHVWRELVVPTD